MEVIIIGSGTAVPSPRRGPPAVALKAAGKVVLLDLGAGTLRALLSVDLDFTRVDIIGLSHFHVDHVGDLAPFLFATHYSLGYHRQAPFWLLAAQGFTDFFHGLKGAFGDWIEPPPGLMKVKELSTTGPDEFRGDDLMIKTAPVRHIASSIAFRIEAEGRAVVYSGDTDISDSLVNLATGADLLILEAANPTKIPGHLTPAEAGELASRTGVPRLILTHFYPPCDQMDVVAACAQNYAGEIIRAEDGLKVTV
ncbi:MAG: MBL fold metallo-hydrolase [Desulfobacteraceae bacterium]